MVMLLFSKHLSFHVEGKKTTFLLNKDNGSKRGKWQTVMPLYFCFHSNQYMSMSEIWDQTISFEIKLQKRRSFVLKREKSRPQVSALPAIKLDASFISTGFNCAFNPPNHLGSLQSFWQLTVKLHELKKSNKPYVVCEHPIITSEVSLFMWVIN